MSVIPGVRRPSRSASVIMNSAGLSLTLPAGLFPARMHVRGHARRASAGKQACVIACEGDQHRITEALCVGGRVRRQGIVRTNTDMTGAAPSSLHSTTLLRAAICFVPSRCNRTSGVLPTVLSIVGYTAAMATGMGCSKWAGPPALVVGRRQSAIRQVALRSHELRRHRTRPKAQDTRARILMRRICILQAHGTSQRRRRQRTPARSMFQFRRQSRQLRARCRNQMGCRSWQPAPQQPAPPQQPARRQRQEAQPPPSPAQPSPGCGCGCGSNPGCCCACGASSYACSS